VDLLIYAVCRSLGLETRARPILEPYGEDGHDFWLNRSDDHDFGFGDYEFKNNYIVEAHEKARGRLGDFQNIGFHVPPYEDSHQESSREYWQDREEEREESLDPILPEYRNTSDDPAKYPLAQHPLAQHHLTLEYRNPGREAMMQQYFYAPKEQNAKMEYLKLNLQAQGLVPPPKTGAVRVGSKFHQLKMPTGKVKDEVVRCDLLSIRLSSPWH
jgi:hypothetical protein